MRSDPKRIVVRSNRDNLYVHTFPEDIPPFTGIYYMAGVPQDKMPEK